MAIKWYIVQTPHSSHLLPTEDVLEHTTMTPCWCQPKQDPDDPDHMIHNNFLPDAEGEGEEPDDGKYHS